MQTTERISPEVREHDRSTNVYRLHQDGTYEDCYHAEPSVFIDDKQAYSMWKPEVAEHILRYYGPYVGILEGSEYRVLPSKQETVKNILGC